MSGGKLSVGPPYFNATTGPLALLLVAVMAVGPAMRWRRDSGSAVLRRVRVPGILAMLALLAIVVLVPGLRILPVLGLALAIGVGLASLAPLWGRNLRRVPLITWGMVFAHLGIAVSLLGMASEAAFSQETLVASRIGEVQRVGPYALVLRDVTPVAGPNWTALEARIDVRRGDGEAFTLFPQARAFSSPPTQTSEAAIETRLDGQLYVVLGKQADGGRWQLRLWWKPLVTLIWAGGILIALGGALSLIGRWRRERGQASRRELALMSA